VRKRQERAAQSERFGHPQRAAALLHWGSYIIYTYLCNLQPTESTNLLSTMYLYTGTVRVLTRVQHVCVFHIFLSFLARSVALFSRIVIVGRPTHAHAWAHGVAQGGRTRDPASPSIAFASASVCYV
jgi:hypothetical protein